MPYAVVVGEALMDMFESVCEGEPVYQAMVGGAPLNVAAGIARLGAPVEFIGSVGGDVFGDRIWKLLAATGVGTRASRRVDAPTALAVTSLRDGVPSFRFYGEPPSYSLLTPDDIDRDLIAGAGALYCGSLALLYDKTLAAARKAWSIPGPLRVFDPNVRPSMLRDPIGLRLIVEEFAGTADLVKLSEPDGLTLFGLAPRQTAAHLRATGARAVIVTLGAKGALLDVDGEVCLIEPPEVAAIDTTGAGDASMAALMHALLTHGVPDTAARWRDVASFATAVAAFSCETKGAATAVPAMPAILARLAGASAGAYEEAGR